MNLSPAASLPHASGHHGGSHAGGGKHFAATLAAVSKDPLNANPTEPTESDAHHQALVHQSQQLVAQTFFGTMLKQMRESPFKSKMFDGGHGGQAYSELYDQKLIEHMSRGAGGDDRPTKNGAPAQRRKSLVQAIVRKLEAAYKKQAATGAATTRPAEQVAGTSGLGVEHATAGALHLPAKQAAASHDDAANLKKNVRIHVAGAARS